MSTDVDWERWAQTAPYFAVLTKPEYRTLTPETRVAFFHTGQAHLAHVMDFIRTRIDPNFAPQTALDFGCGVGRVLIPLAMMCKAYGVDVSQSMLRRAKENAAEFDVDVNLSHKIEGCYDFIHSHIVFQHIPPKKGMWLAKKLLGALNPGGIAVLHFTYADTRPFLTRSANWLRYRFPVIHYISNPLRGRPLLEPMMQMHAYDLNELMPLFAGTDLFIEHRNHGGMLGAVLYSQAKL